jgi:23S rRNA (cytidine1920-2'-O)/16S rRNA (cytidine1409-2'-O)-methyltransferase
MAKGIPGRRGDRNRSHFRLPPSGFRLSSLSMAARTRLDELLVARGLAPTRAQAKALIMTGRVRHGTDRLDKPGKDYPNDFEVTIDQPPRFVSRGGEKLTAYLERFPVNLMGAHLLDVGASTGGFSDCALQAGAASATCVDVGHGQLHDKLRRDPRVANIEKMNARHLAAGDLPRTEYDVVVIDLSFISLKTVLPAVWPFLRPGGTLIALVKPQFEAGRAEVQKGEGIIRDDLVRERVLAEVRDFAVKELPGATVRGEMECPVHGADGNREYLLGLAKA